MAERNIRLTLSYDGTNFVGWQIQQNGRSVQGELQDALERMHHHPVAVNGAGRTDSGVHATGQVANFMTDIAGIPACRFSNALNGLLPLDVRVRRSEGVPAEFHARYDAVSRTYRYFVMHVPVLPIAYVPFTQRVSTRPDIVRINRMARTLVGEHDFTTFSGPIETNWVHDAPPSRVRRVFSASMRPAGDRIVFEISASGFLWRMVRSIVGTLLELDARGAHPEEFRELLDARARGGAGTTAPARGLFLHRVDYDAGEGGIA